MHLWKLRANIIHSNERRNDFPPHKIKNKTEQSALTTYITRALRPESEIKGIHIGKEVMLFIFPGDIVLYMDNFKEYTHQKKKSLLEELVSSARWHDTNQYTDSTIFLFIRNE